MKKLTIKEAVDLLGDLVKILAAVGAAVKIYRYFRPKQCSCDCKCKKAMLG